MKITVNFDTDNGKEMVDIYNFLGLLLNKKIDQELVNPDKKVEEKEVEKKPTPAKPKAEKKPPKKVEAKPIEEDDLFDDDEDEKEEPKEWTEDDIKKALTDYAKSHSKEAAKDVLATYSASGKLKDVDPDQYVDLMSELI